MASTANKIFINGRFLTQKTTGVQRFAREIVRALDNVLVKDSAKIEMTLVAPWGTPPLPGITRIGFLPFGPRRGHLWEQIDLPRVTKGGFLVNLGPSGPLLKQQQLTIIHDAAVYRYPKNYSFAYGVLHRTLERLLARISNIGTVSCFSCDELAKFLRLQGGDIAIIPNGYEHILSVAPDDGIQQKLALHDRPYFLFVGSTTPNKNLVRAIGAFVSLNQPDTAFVIVGSSEKSVYRSGLGEIPLNIILPGRLSDAEIVALYRHATALVFPSLYEGFGIPPLEAMALGCPVTASRIPPIEEVCGDAALYFNPLDETDIARCMKDILASKDLRNDLIEKGNRRLPLFTWADSARRLLATISR